MKLDPVIPFEPITTNNPPSSDTWVTQVKWDGVRVLTYCDGNEVKLINRNLNERTLQYPELTNMEKYCTASSFILDGEIIAMDQARPSFTEIMKRDRLKKRLNIEFAVKQIPVTYMVFDILYLNGQWVTDAILAKRQELLEKIIVPSNQVQVVKNFTNPLLLLEQMKNYQMEGIICKNLESTYLINGKDSRWQKTKIFHDLYAVIGGVTLRHNAVNSVLLGVYDQDKLIYIGHAGTGKLKVKDWQELTKRIQSFIIKERPFDNEPERTKEAIWIRPEITVKVQFMEWTPGGTMRHPSIQSLVEIPAGECTVNQSTR